MLQYLAILVGSFVLVNQSDVNSLMSLFFRLKDILPVEV